VKARFEALGLEVLISPRPSVLHCITILTFPLEQCALLVAVIYDIRVYIIIAHSHILQTFYFVFLLIFLKIDFGEIKRYFLIYVYLNNDFF